MIEFDLNLNTKIWNPENVLPLFKYNSNIIFKSLTIFKLHVGFLDLYYLNNISDNLNNMPNLKHFELFSSTEGYYEDLMQLYEKLSVNKMDMLIELDSFKIDIKLINY